MNTRSLFLFIAFFSVLAPLLSQDGNCYDQTRQDGIDAYDGKRYNESINHFFVAYRCLDCPTDNDLAIQIKRSQQAQIKVLETAVADAKIAQELARQEAANAKISEEEAIENKKIANIAGQRAESLRLALLADLMGSNNNYAEALPLAYLAIQLRDSTTQDAAYKSFASIVRDSFSHYIQIEGTLSQMETAGNGLVIVDDSGIRYIQEDHDTLQTTQVNDAKQKCWHFDEEILAISPFGGTSLQLYSINDIPQQSHSLQSHTEAITDFAVSKNYYLTCSRDDTAILWNKQGQQLATLTGHQGNIYQGLISEQEGKVITRSSDGTIIFWNLNGEQIARISEERPYIQSMTLSEDGSQLLCHNAHQNISVYDVATQARLHQLSTTESTPLAQVFFCDAAADFVTCQNLDNQAEIWSTDGTLKDTTSNIVLMNYFEQLDQMLISLASGQIMTFDQNMNREHWNSYTQPLSDLLYCSDSQSWLVTLQDGATQFLDQNKKLLFIDQVDPQALDQGVLPSTFGHGEYIVLPGDGHIKIIPHPTNILAQTNFEDDFLKAIAEKHQVHFLEFPED